MQREDGVQDKDVPHEYAEEVHFQRARSSRGILMCLQICPDKLAQKLTTTTHMDSM